MFANARSFSARSLTRDHCLSITLLHPPFQPSLQEKKSQHDDTQGSTRTRACETPPSLFFDFFFLSLFVAMHVAIARGKNRCDTRSPPAVHLLLDDKEWILQRHSFIRSVFEFKVWVAACLAATAARHPRRHPKRVRASTARSSVERNFERNRWFSEEWCAELSIVGAAGRAAIPSPSPSGLRQEYANRLCCDSTMSDSESRSHSRYRDVCSGSGAARRYLFDLSPSRYVAA